MGRKNGAVSASEPVAEQQTHNTTTQLESSKKKNKKNKHNLQNEENTPKRRHEELNAENDAESEKKSKKKKKHNKSKDNGEENGTGNGADTVSASDEPIVVTGKNAGDEKYAAVKSFVGSGLPDNVLECCKGFEKPSPIQSRAWPFLLDGRDLIGIAATGSGKTLAFGLPAIMHVLNKRKSKVSSKGRNPLCLMLSPTRELAQQARKKEEKLNEAFRKIEPTESSETTDDPKILTLEEHFFFLTMGLKSKNYVPVGRRGIYQGVILNMLLHWKKHQTLQVVVKTFSAEEGITIDIVTVEF